MSQYRSHNHNFLLIEVKHPYYCQRCNQFGFGKSYSCENSECNLNFHEECADPKSMVNHPFSTKCVFKFYTNTPEKGRLCHVCAKSIKGYHYRCSCNYVKRFAHPTCLSYKPTLVACDGLTMYLKKEASANCLKCGNKDFCKKVDGWAYVSPCGTNCYHVSCVMDIIHANWNQIIQSGKTDPFEIVKDRFPDDMSRVTTIVTAKPKDRRKRVNAVMALSVIFNGLTGNVGGLIGDARGILQRK